MSESVNVPLTIAPTDAKHRASAWRVVSGPETDPVFVSEVAAHLRISDDEANADPTQFELFISAAVDYAESLMNTSLMPRVIEATFYDRCAPIVLPRGPILDVSSVVDADDSAITDYRIEHVGRSARIVLPHTRLEWPVTVTYRAGYSDISEIPASIRLAILAHCGAMYEAREATSETQRTVNPLSLESFYKLQSRNVGIG